MNEKNNDVLNNNTNNSQEGNLNYSFDFAGQVEKETPVTPAPAEVPVAPTSVETPVTPAPAEAPVTPTSVETPVPMAEMPAANNKAELEAPQEEVTETSEITNDKDKKSTVAFIVVLVVIIVAFIIALPYILNFLG